MELLPESRVPKEHPLRPVRALVERVIAEHALALGAVLPTTISSERLVKSMVLMVLHSIRSDRLFCEMLDYNLLFRWFLGLSMVEEAFDPDTFVDSRERLLAREAARRCLRTVVERANASGLLRHEHFSVDLLLVERWATARPPGPAKGKLVGLPAARPAEEGERTPEVPDVDPMRRARSVCDHLIATFRPDDAARYLSEHAPALLRIGDPAELLRVVESIPVEHRSTELRIARARICAHALDLTGAYDELERLVAEGAEPRRDIDLLLAGLALRTARFDAGAAALQRVLDDPGSSANQRVAAASYTLLLTFVGRGDEARRLSERMITQARTQEHAALLAVYRAFSHWLDERDGDAADCLPYARSLLDQGALTDVASLLGAALFGCVLGRRGELDEAERLHRMVDSLLAVQANPLVSIDAQAARAFTRLEAGERHAAMGELRACAAAMAHSGYVIGALGLNAWIGRILLTLGRRREALHLLDEVEASARRLGAFGLVQLVERSRGHDPLIQLARPPAPPPSELKRGEVARDRALRALRAAAAGDAQPARFLDDAPGLEDKGYALDRAIGRLARAIAAQLHGGAAEATAELARATGEAARGNVDAELLPELARALGSFRVVTLTDQRLVSDAPSDADLERYGIVLDGRSQELRAGQQTISVKRRPVLRRLLFALAGCPGKTLTKEVLVPLVWDGEYNPLRHDGPIKSNVNELRRLIMPFRLTIEFDRGYRLDPGDSFLFIEPFALF
jgi:transposase/tetratricopeptide (TPR) repeat protein